MSSCCYCPHGRMQRVVACDSGAGDGHEQTHGPSGSPQDDGRNTPDIRRGGVDPRHVQRTNSGTSLKRLCLPSAHSKKRWTRKPSLEVAPTTLATFYSCDRELNFDLERRTSIPNGYLIQRLLFGQTDRQTHTPDRLLYLGHSLLTDFNPFHRSSK